MSQWGAQIQVNAGSPAQGRRASQNDLKEARQPEKSAVEMRRLREAAAKRSQEAKPMPTKPGPKGKVQKSMIQDAI